MKFRDFVRFGIAGFIITMSDLAFYHLLDFPLNEHSENLILAVGFTILMAIRENYE